MKVVPADSRTTDQGGSQRGMGWRMNADHIEESVRKKELYKRESMRKEKVVEKKAE